MFLIIIAIIAYQKPFVIFFFFVFIFIFLQVFTNKRLYITSVQDINKFTSIVYIYTYMFRITCYVILYYRTPF